MKNTVVIFNAGIGALTLGFQNAGYEILKAYEPDKKTAEFYQENIDGKINICSLSLMGCVEVPDGDVWAFDLTRSEEDVFYSLDLVKNRRPPVILFVMKKKLHDDIVNRIIFQLNEYEYHVAYKNIRSSEFTGFPLREDFMYVVAKKENAPDMVIPERCHKNSVLMDTWAEMKPEDSWYYRINFEKEKIDASHTGDSILCWKREGYRETSQITWNLIKMPLIRIHGVYHKITHREIARLKGFPEEFPRSVSNKKRMYRNLVYAPNIIVTEQIVRNLGRGSYVMSESDVSMKNRENTVHFKHIFEKFLTYKESSYKAGSFQNSEKWNFVIKMYSDFKEIATLNRLQSYSRLAGKAVSDQKKKLPSQNICVVANLVSDEIKRKYEEAKLGYVWDIRNVLWLFEDYPELKNELISILNYSVETMEPEKPEPYIFEEENNQTENMDPESVADSYIAQLEALTTGTATFRKYEELCVSILKYILGEYLTLWEQQKTTEENLYRFDMCCKIKNGVTQDFFDTICKYFSTKYIVFEFKNDEKSITQREIYTTEKYLYEKALRKVAIIISRKGADKHAKMAARGSLRESGKLIICLSDEDLKAMLQIKKEGEKTTGEYLENILDDMLMRLEK